MRKREIVVYVILSILTCGLFSLYWLVTITDDTAELSGNNEMSGGLALLFSLITCGIYGIYWSYKIGKELEEAGKKHGKNISDNSVVYLILDIFGLSIVNFCLMQNDINSMINE